MRYWTLIICLLFFSVPLLYGNRIFGIVTDEEKNPIEGAMVELQNSFNQAEARLMLTNSIGRFIFTNLKPDTYRVTIRKDGWLEWTSGKLVVPNKEMQTVVAVLRPVPMDPIVFIYLCCLSIAILAVYSMLVFNFMIAPVPKKAASLVAWTILIAAVFSSFFMVERTLALAISLGAVPVAALLTWTGVRRQKEKKQENQQASQYEVAQDKEYDKLAFFVGLSGVAMTDLKPCGNAHILVEVRSSRDFIPKNTKIIVKKIENGKLLVEPEISHDQPI